MGHCQKIGFTLEKGDCFTRMETTSLRRSHHFKAIIRTRSNPVHRTELQTTRCLPVQRTQKISGVKHSYWSGVKNEQVLLTAHQKAKTRGKQLIIPISERLVNRQVKLYGHLARANGDDLMNEVTMYQDGTRRKSLFKRVGRPRTKWHTVARKHTIKQLMDKNVIPPYWNIHMKDPELDHIIIQAAADRYFWKALT